MPSAAIQWFQLSGSVAAWIALIYLIIIAIWGSPELRAIKEHLKSVDNHYKSIDTHLKRMDKYILRLIEKIPGGKES